MHCNSQRKHFYSFVLSVDGMLRKEVIFVLANLIRLMADKLEEPLSHIPGWYNGRIKIRIIRLYSGMICGASLHSSLRDQEPDWDP